MNNIEDIIAWEKRINEEKRKKIQQAIKSGARNCVPKENNCKNCPHYLLEVAEAICPWNDTPTGNYRYFHKCGLYKTLLSVKEYNEDSNIEKCFACYVHTMKDNNEITDTEIDVYLMLFAFSLLRYKTNNDKNKNDKYEEEKK